MILISLLAYRQDRSILVVPGSNINNSVKEAGLIGSFAAATLLFTFFNDINFIIGLPSGPELRCGKSSEKTRFHFRETTPFFSAT